MYSFHVISIVIRIRQVKFVSLNDMPDIKNRLQLFNYLTAIFPKNSVVDVLQGPKYASGDTKVSGKELHTCVCVSGGKKCQFFGKFYVRTK